MKIIQTISEHKQIKRNPISSYRKPAPLKNGYKRIEAIVEVDGIRQTRHLDIPRK